MTTDKSTASRRGVLRGAIGAVAGLVGIGAAAKLATGDDSSSALDGTASFTLRGTDFRFTAVGRIPGRLPVGDEAPSVHGAISGADGTLVGSFRSATVPGSAGQFSLHHFELDDGTLLGMGSGSLDEAAFVVVGGTGRYHGATGSYIARQRPRELGGDGTAEFELTITSKEHA